MADDSQRLARELRRLQRNINNVARTNRFQIIALKNVEGLMKNRIFNRGLASNERKIGQYSTKPILIGASTFPIRSGARKALGTKKARRSKDWVTLPDGRRLAVLKGGYKEVRELQGRQTSFVDLEVTSDLRNSIQVGKTPDGGNAMGFVSDEQATIAAGNEDRFKKEIFSLSKSEEKAFDRAIVREFDRLIRQTFGR